MDNMNFTSLKEKWYKNIFALGFWTDELEQVSMCPVLTSECLDSEGLSLDFKLTQFWKLHRSVSVNRSDFNIEVSKHKCGNTESIKLSSDLVCDFE